MKKRLHDLKLLLEILKSVVFGGIVSMLIDLDITVIKVAVTISTIALTFYVSRIILKEERDDNRRQL